MAGHGGGAWKVAYADFVTAMMAFFMVMWITAQSKQMKAAVAQYFNDPSGTSSKAATGSGGPAPMKTPYTGGPLKAPKTEKDKRHGSGAGSSGIKLLEKESKRNGVANPHMLVIHEGDQSNVGSMILFADDSAELDAEAKSRLKQFMPMILGKPNKVEIRAHTWRRPPAPNSRYPDPWQLCFARAMAVRDFLEQQGVESRRLRLSEAGVHEPFTIVPEVQKQAQNSRVELYVLGEWGEELEGTPEERAERFRTPREKSSGADGKASAEPAKSP